MKYRYNGYLEIQHIDLGDRMANYFGTTESVILVHEERKGRPDYVVASFDEHGHCTNASRYFDQDKAWDFFYEIMREIRNIPAPTNET